MAEFHISAYLVLNVYIQAYVFKGIVLGKRFFVEPVGSEFVTIFMFVIIS